MRSTLHLLSLLMLTIFASQAWPVMAVPATLYEYDVSIKDTSAENTELEHQNYAYDNIENLQHYGVKAITSSQDEKTKIGSFFAFDNGLFATKSGQKLLASPRRHLLDSVTDQKLRNRIDALYRPNAKVGSGSTADAIRHELRTGELLSPKGHFQKGIEMRNGLMKDLKSGRLNNADSAIARQTLKDLQNALSGQ